MQQCLLLLIISSTDKQLIYTHKLAYAQTNTQIRAKGVFYTGILRQGLNRSPRAARHKNLLVEAATEKEPLQTYKFGVWQVRLK
jgi:hypothetical protein